MKFQNANMFGKVGANLSQRTLESYPTKWLEHIFQERASLSSSVPTEAPRVAYVLYPVIYVAWFLTYFFLRTCTRSFPPTVIVFDLPSDRPLLPTLQRLSLHPAVPRCCVRVKPDEKFNPPLRNPFKYRWNNLSKLIGNTRVYFRLKEEKSYSAGNSSREVYYDPRLRLSSLSEKTFFLSVVLHSDNLGK